MTDETPPTAPPRCSQCARRAVVALDDIPLCVEHHLMMQQAAYLQASYVAAQFNVVAGELEAGMGHLMRVPRMHLAPPPFMGPTVNMNNIKVTDSNIGLVNTGTLRNVQNIDASVTIARTRGHDELAQAIQEFTQAVVDNTDVDKAVKQQLAESLEFLTAQINAEPEHRSKRVANSVVRGMKDLLAGTAVASELWRTLEPLLIAALELTD